MIRFGTFFPIKHPPPFECVFVNKRPFISTFDGITESDVEDGAAESFVIDASDTEAIDVE